MSLESDAHGEGGHMAFTGLIESETTNCAEHRWIKSVVKDFECVRR